MLRAQIRQPPAFGRQDGELPPFRERRAVGQHELQVLAAFPGLDSVPRQWMAGRCDGDEFHPADRLPLQRWMIRQDRAADRQVGPSVEQTRCHRTQSFHLQAKRDARKNGAKLPQDGCGRIAGQHDVDYQRNRAFLASMQALRLGEQRVDPVGDGFRFGQQPLARLGQDRAARSLAVEQGDAKLRLHLRDAVTYGRYRTPHLARRRTEAAFLCHGKEDAQLIEARLGQFHCSQFLNILAHFIALIGTVGKP